MLSQILRNNTHPYYFDLQLERTGIRDKQWKDVFFFAAWYLHKKLKPAQLFSLFAAPEFLTHLFICLFVVKHGTDSI